MVASYPLDLQISWLKDKLIANLVNYGTLARFASIVKCPIKSSIISALYYKHLNRYTQQQPLCIYR